VFHEKNDATAIIKIHSNLSLQDPLEMGQAKGSVVTFFQQLHHRDTFYLLKNHYLLLEVVVARVRYQM
jgi:hypothetical protein